MHPLVIVGIAFFIFLTVSAVAGIVAELKKRQYALDAVRVAIERGHPLDPALVDRLIDPEPAPSRLNPLHLRVGGIITSAAGAGIGLLALIVMHIVPQALYLGLGLAGLAICVGLGLVIAAAVVARDPDQPRHRAGRVPDIA